jgi:hypothetical protein
MLVAAVRMEESMMNQRRNKKLLKEKQRSMKPLMIS